MKLNLERPLLFFDLEATGINPSDDRIVEISIIKVFPDGTDTEYTRRVNPGIPIPPESTAVHHITDTDVADAPHFADLADEIAGIFAGCDIAGFNSSRFDIPMLDQEFQRLRRHLDLSQARFIDVQTIFHKKEQRTLVAAYRFYCNKELDGAHSANADTRATYEVLKAQLDRYPDLSNDVSSLSAFSTQQNNIDYAGRLVRNAEGRAVINFGKHKGRLATDILEQEPGYLGWILRGDFPENTKEMFRRIQEGIIK